MDELADVVPVYVDLDEDLVILQWPDGHEIVWEGRNIAKQVLDVIDDPSAHSDQYADLLRRIVGPEKWAEAERLREDVRWVMRNT